jgi:hypothetical protein
MTRLCCAAAAAAAACRLQVVGWPPSGVQWVCQTYHLLLLLLLQPLLLLQIVSSHICKLCLPFGVLRVLAQLRIGWAHLEVEQGRKCRPKVPREARLCRLCSGDDATLAMRQAVLARTSPQLLLLSLLSPPLLRR